jgi:hypothetical protein
VQTELRGVGCRQSCVVLGADRVVGKL